MTLIRELTKAVKDNTPVYAAVGVADLAAQKVRDARTRASRTRVDLRMEHLQAKAEQAASQAQQLPAQAIGRTLVVAGRAQGTYGDLARRGQTLLERIRDQKATKDLIAQADTMVSQGKGAVTTVRRAAGDSQRAAFGTLGTAGREGADAAAEVAGSTRREARTTASTARKGAARTRTSAKRTTATAGKRAANTKRATKATATSARKTTAKASKAAQTAADKVGD